MTVTNDITTPIYRKLQRAFPLRPIRTKAQAQAATKILDVHFRDNYDDSDEEAYALALATLLADYEDIQEAREPEATGLEVIQHLMEAQDMTQTQLAKILGVSQSGVSQILSGNRQITADHARRLGKYFRMNPGLFL